MVMVDKGIGSSAAGHSLPRYSLIWDRTKDPRLMGYKENRD